jgi:hypothetical protein
MVKKEVYQVWDMGEKEQAYKHTMQITWTRAPVADQTNSEKCLKDSHRIEFTAGPNEVSKQFKCIL